MDKRRGDKGGLEAMGTAQRKEERKRGILFLLNAENCGGTSDEGQKGRRGWKKDREHHARRRGGGVVKFVEGWLLLDLYFINYAQA